MRRYSKEDEEEDEKNLNGKDKPSDSEDEERHSNEDDRRSSNSKDNEDEKDSEKRSIFVKNLSFQTKETEFKEFFEKYGSVSRANIIMRDGRSKGMGFIDFEDPKDARKIVESSENFELEGRPLTISWANDKKPSSNSGEKTKTIFVGNLSFKATEDSIQDFFSDCGKIESVRIAKLSDGKSKGFCHIDFSTEDEAENALKKNGEDFEGRSLRVDKTLPRSGGSDRRGGRGGFRGSGRGGGKGHMWFRGDRSRDRGDRDRDRDRSRRDRSRDDRYDHGHHGHHRY